MFRRVRPQLFTGKWIPSHSAFRHGTFLGEKNMVLEHATYCQLPFRVTHSYFQNEESSQEITF
jgi:hypothetical protein